MYRKVTQLKFEDFVFPYGELDPENEWVKLANLVPWDVAEREYAKQCVDNGHPAHPARIALGSQIIKQKLRCSDDWVVRHVSENPYLQYFLDTVDKSVVLWYNEEKRTGVFLHGEQLSTARYVRCDVGNSQAVHNRKQGNVGRQRKGYPSISEWRVLDFENGSTMERPAAGIW